MRTRRFWVDAGERAAKSAAQALLLLWGGDEVFSAWHADWRTAAGIAASAAVLSVLTSVGSARLAGDPASPSLTGGQR